MSWKTISAVIGAAIMTFMVTFFMTRGTEVVEAGLDAKTEAQIKKVMEEVMRVDFNGETLTYGQLLSSLDTKVTALTATVGVLVAE